VRRGRGRLSLFGFRCGSRVNSSGFGLLAENFLVLDHRQKSQEFPEIPCGQFRINSSFRFLAKNSNARYTKFPRIRRVSRPRFLG